MSMIESIPGLSDFVSNIKVFVFGENNSRIDSILDYFFSLRQEKRTKIIFYSCIGIFVLFLLIIFLYFFGLYKLQKSLDQATNNIQELNSILPSFVSVSHDFSKNVDGLKQSNQYSSIIGSLEEKTKSLGLEISALPKKPTLIDLQNTDPLFGQFQKVKIDYKISNISLTKIITYLTAVKQMDNHFKITKFEIQQKFGTKLYFDTGITLEAYVPSGKSE